MSRDLPAVARREALGKLGQVEERDEGVVTGLTPDGRRLWYVRAFGTDFYLLCVISSVQSLDAQECVTHGSACRNRTSL